ncbi:hypothetical protein BGW80DRAFT_1320128 [Lactifluus volemus]|nr:hypothetical protein BGW80DRAFT_1387643 [Lactifluus volemus]KAH9971475.1 hypothetical protein BGW80DRAFT_1320128 [Lactifluus volemus]
MCFSLFLPHHTPFTRRFFYLPFGIATTLSTMPTSHHTLQSSPFTPQSKHSLSPLFLIAYFLLSVLYI